MQRSLIIFWEDFTRHFLTNLLENADIFADIFQAS